MVAVILIGSLAGHIFWSLTRQACFQYVHHVLEKKYFNDTLILSHSSDTNVADLVWLSDNELQYKGRMFDVKQKLETPGNILLVGKYDNFENDLFKLLKKLVDDNEPADEESNDITTLTAVLPRFKPNLIALSILKEKYNDLWSNNFRYSIDIPPMHYPPDRIV